MNNGFVDLIVYVGGTFLLFVIGMVVGPDIAPRFFQLWLVASVFAWALLLKFVWPAHIALKHTSWLYLVLTAILALAIVFLIIDGSLLGLWTFPTIILLAVLCGVVVRFLGPRFRDDDGEVGRR